MKTLKTMISNFKRYSFLMRQLIIRDFKIKYKRSVLGVLWSILYPLMIMSVMALIFSNMFKFSMEGVNYLVYLMSGLIIWNYFSEATNNSLTAVTGNFSLINKVYIPKYIFPIAKCLFAGINFLFTLIPFLLIVLLSGNAAEGTKCTINICYLYIPIVFIGALMFTIGLSYLLSTVTVFLRDVLYIWGIVLTMLNYFTPIFYSITILPVWLQNILKLNPLYIYINTLREIVLFGNRPTILYLFSGLFAGFVSMVIGMIIFRKKQDKFVYYI
ncbi:MAG: ABC transporter permease [Bacilli bacterium]|nr:ABC transporter permease [Bacilli bacterium]